MAVLQTYSSVVVILGSFFILWFGSPQVHNNLLEFVSNLNPLYHQVSHLYQIPFQVNLGQLSSDNTVPIEDSVVLPVSSWSHIVPNPISQYLLPMFDATKFLLFGCFSHALLIYLIPQKHLFPKIHLMGKLIPVLFWILVSWVTSTDWGLNDFSLASLTYIYSL